MQNWKEREKLHDNKSALWFGFKVSGGDLLLEWDEAILWRICYWSNWFIQECPSPLSSCFFVSFNPKKLLSSAALMSDPVNIHLKTAVFFPPLNWAIWREANNHPEAIPTQQMWCMFTY